MFLRTVFEMYDLYGVRGIFHLMDFDAILLDCHRIVGGMWLDHR